MASTLEELWQQAPDCYGLASCWSLSDPDETLGAIIATWWDLGRGARSFLEAYFVNQTRNWSPNKDLVQPVYILTRKRDPLQLSVPLGSHRCAMWCDRIRLGEACQML